jgi:drug/metabolite transporter (DMT)-like permease
MSTIPAVVALLSRVFLREQIPRQTWVGICCAAIGIALYSATKQQQTIDYLKAIYANKSQNNFLIGNALIFGAVVCEASYAVIGKKLTSALSPKRISALINLWGLTLITPMGIWAAWRFDFASVSNTHWALLVFYGLAASVWTV